MKGWRGVFILASDEVQSRLEEVHMVVSSELAKSDVRTEGRRTDKVRRISITWDELLFRAESSHLNGDRLRNQEARSLAWGDSEDLRNLETLYDICSES